jgi:hypothetical protein
VLVSCVCWNRKTQRLCFRTSTSGAQQTRARDGLCRTAYITGRFRVTARRGVAMQCLLSRLASTGQAAFQTAQGAAAQLALERQPRRRSARGGCCRQAAQPGRRLPMQRLRRRGASPPSACCPGQDEHQRT